MVPLKPTLLVPVSLNAWFLQLKVPLELSSNTFYSISKSYRPNESITPTIKCPKQQLRLLIITTLIAYATIARIIIVAIIILIGQFSDENKSKDFLILGSKSLSSLETKKSPQIKFAPSTDYFEQSDELSNVPLEKTTENQKISSKTVEVSMRLNRQLKPKEHQTIKSLKALAPLEPKKIKSTFNGLSPLNTASLELKRQQLTNCSKDSSLNETSNLNLQLRKEQLSNSNDLIIKTTPTISLNETIKKSICSLSNKMEKKKNAKMIKFISIMILFKKLINILINLLLFISNEDKQQLTGKPKLTINKIMLKMTRPKVSPNYKQLKTIKLFLIGEKQTAQLPKDQPDDLMSNHRKGKPNNQNGHHLFHYDQKYKIYICLCLNCSFQFNFLWKLINYTPISLISDLIDSLWESILILLFLNCDHQSLLETSSSIP